MAVFSVSAGNIAVPVKCLSPHQVFVTLSSVRQPCQVFVIPSSVCQPRQMFVTPSTVCHPIKCLSTPSNVCYPVNCLSPHQVCHPGHVFATPRLPATVQQSWHGCVFDVCSEVSDNLNVDLQVTDGSVVQILPSVCRHRPLSVTVCRNRL